MRSTDTKQCFARRASTSPTTPEKNEIYRANANMAPCYELNNKHMS